MFEEIQLPNGEAFIAQDNIYGTEWMVFHRYPDDHVKTIKNCLDEVEAKRLAVELAAKRANEIGITLLGTSEKPLTALILMNQNGKNE